MQPDLSGKVVVITGASMGIGEALAKAFADAGASVVLSSRDAARAEAARQRIGHMERTMALACDVRTREEIERLVSLAVHNFGRVDVWINNAGYGLIDTISQADRDQIRKLFETNLFGAIDGMQVVLPVMKRQGSGTIINISSVAGHIPTAGSSIYAASKFAMNAVGKAARVELQGTGINVMTVCPGYIATDFGLNAVKGRERLRPGAAGRRGASVETVARATINGYLKGKREVVVPWWYHLVIKLYQLFPGVVEKAMKKGLRNADEVIAEAQAARRR